MRKLRSLFVASACCSVAFVGVTFAACQENEKTNTNVTTVSEAEWEDALALENFTAIGFLTENGEQEPVIFKGTATAYYSENDGYTSWCVKRTDGWYMYAGESGDGQIVEEFTSAVDSVLRSFHLPDFSAWDYVETQKAYVCVNADYPENCYRFSAYFKGGKLVKFESQNASEEITYSFEFGGYGTTVLELPEYLR
ncbi:MAG: hypothetical protein IJB97_08795 [Clostridia bacterium]|nr:hypothetical protein [Clostridia bacterium]